MPIIPCGTNLTVQMEAFMEQSACNRAQSISLIIPDHKFDLFGEPIVN